MSESSSAPPNTGKPTGRVVVVSGGTDGMGRALALARADRGDLVVAIGSNPAKGEALLAEAARSGVAGRVRFVRADLATVAGNRRVLEDIFGQHDKIDALALFANRQAPSRTLTANGLESTFALYYLSRYVLSYGFREALEASTTPVIVNIAGVGITKGSIHWDDLQLERNYSMIAAQLQAARANDLLGVAYTGHTNSKIPYVLYHPGFTRSGDLSPLPAVLRASIRAAAKISARPITESISAIHHFIGSGALSVVTQRHGAPRAVIRPACLNMRLFSVLLRLPARRRTATTRPDSTGLTLGRCRPQPSHSATTECEPEPLHRHTPRHRVDRDRPEQAPTTDARNPESAERGTPRAGNRSAARRAPRRPVATPGMFLMLGECSAAGCLARRTICKHLRP